MELTWQGTVRHACEVPIVGTSRLSSADWVTEWRYRRDACAAARCNVVLIKWQVIKDDGWKRTYDDVMLALARADSFSLVQGEPIEMVPRIFGERIFRKECGGQPGPRI
jgi:hypothetical protein